ncbi:hypothetical protein F4801DRAFT_573565, partial [Xylaria longipes]
MYQLFFKPSARFSLTFNPWRPSVSPITPYKVVNLQQVFGSQYGQRSLRYNMATFEEVGRSPGGDREMLNRDDDDDGIYDEDDDDDLTDIWKLLLLKETSEGDVGDFTEPDSLKRFFDDWGSCLGKTVGKEGNILHRLLLHCEEKDIDRMAHLRDAVTLIVQKYPFLLWKNRTKHGYDSPLWQAISQKEATIVKAFMEGLKLSNQSQAPELKILLRQPVDRGQRSMLQWAIEMHLEEDAIQAMLVHVSDDSLSVQDSDGRTALHAALTYGDCTDDRVRTIKQMILQSSNALSVVDTCGRSIYAHHIWSKKQWLEQKRLLEEKAEKERKAISSNRQPVSDTKAKQFQPPRQPNYKSEATKRGSDNQPAGVYGSKRDPDFRSTGMDGMLGYDPRSPSRQEGGIDGGKGGLQADKALRSNQGFRREPLPEPTPIINRTLSVKLQDQLDRVPSFRNERDEQKIAEQKTKAQRRRRMNAEKKEQAAQKMQKKKDEQERAKAKEEAKRRPEILEANSQMVQLEIKLRCMRTLSPKETARILYGNNSKDRQICFDFPDRPTVRLEAFQMSFQRVRFDEVLQYVAFPSVKFERKNSGEEVSSTDGVGRKEMKDIFEWLRKEKKVKRIIKVIVNDFEKPSHSDRAVVESLKGFGVEELQWLKTDLDPETILNVSSDIRKLRLRWSGSNTALRAWSDPYGLRKLQYLDAIQLELEGDEVLESYNDTRQNKVTPPLAGHRLTGHLKFIKSKIYNPCYKSG